jgi:thymidylate synthase (FAD)
MKRINIDDGYIQLVDHMGGGDLSVVNAARVSFGKRKTELDGTDVRLINYLAKHKHMSPFRHMQFSFEIHTSEVVCRQMYKHCVGVGLTSGDQRFVDHAWNEISGRYVEFDQEFHVPTAFRSQHESNKQASLPDEIITENDAAKEIYRDAVDQGYEAYQKLLALGVCKEQARMVIPISFMNTFMWTASLEAVANFIKLRDHEGAQWEIRKLAVAMRTLVGPICPISLDALVDSNL